MTKSEELRILADKASKGEDIDSMAVGFLDRYYPETKPDENVLDALNGAYISRRFFGKSRYWYSQKMNNNIKNGKPADFTDSEWLILKNAIYTLSKELKGLADNMQ